MIGCVLIDLSGIESLQIVINTVLVARRCWYSLHKRCTELLINKVYCFFVTLVSQRFKRLSDLCPLKSKEHGSYQKYCDKHIS